MENKLTEQEFDKIIGKFCKDLKSVLFNALESSSGNSITAEIEESNKEFLTLEEAKEQADFCREYQEGVYEYEIKGEGWTLVEDGKVLIEGVDWVDWHKKGVYDYRIKGKGWTLIEDGKVLIDGAEHIQWFAKGVYSYEIKGEGYTLIEHGEVLIEGVDYVHWIKKGVYEYKMEGEELVKINNNK